MFIEELACRTYLRNNFGTHYSLNYRQFKLLEKFTLQFIVHTPNTMKFAANELKHETLG